MDADNAQPQPIEQVQIEGEEPEDDLITASSEDGVAEASAAEDITVAPTPRRGMGRKISELELEEDIPDAGVVDLSGSLKLEVKPQAVIFPLQELERDARHISSNLMHLLGGLTASLHAMSNISVQYIETHQSTTKSLATSVEASVAHMQTLMASCTQLIQEMPPVENILLQIQVLKKTLDVLEQACTVVVK